MDIFIPAIIIVLLFYTIFFLYLLKSYQNDRNKADYLSVLQDYPDVTVIVPATGTSPGQKECLYSLITQDYPAYNIIFVTRSTEEPAAGIINEVIRDRVNARHIVSGATKSCGQKNHNLIAGLNALPSNTQILVFCDSTRFAEKDWLRKLVTPIARGKERVTSGYHKILSEKPDISSLGHAFCVLIMGLAKRVRRFNQPWGGGTAITRDLFEKLKIEDHWATNIVDDVSMAAILKKTGIATGNIKDAFLSTPLSEESPSKWSIWLTRQWFYLKACIPSSWLAAGLVCHIHCFMILLALYRLVLSSLCLTPWKEAILPAVFLALIFFIVWMIRPMHTGPGPIPRWIAAAFTAFFAASRAHIMSMFAQGIEWHGMYYHVGRGGKVKGIEERKQS